MRLDKASMNKLFDLMIMLTKYQLTVSTGPREVILITLNHIDAMREIVMDENAHECIKLVHQMVVNVRDSIFSSFFFNDTGISISTWVICTCILQLYGNMTMGHVWQTRNDCLDVLDKYSIRVSVLLRLGLQNHDGSFNIKPSNYNENYTKYQDMLNGIKLNDVDCDHCAGGSFALFGNRGTLLGRNVYVTDPGHINDPI